MELSAISKSEARAAEPSIALDVLPDSFKERNKTLVDFLQFYYDYCNQNGQPTYELNNLLRDHDVDLLTDDEYYEAIRRTIAVSAPSDSTLDKPRLYKILLQYYHSRGSKESIVAFFKLFYNEIVDIWYPKEYLFDTSGSRSISSSRYKIQDSNRWQDFSYVINGAVNNSKWSELWKNEFTRFIHPAGLRFFIEFNLFSEAEKDTIFLQDMEDLLYDIPKAILWPLIIEKYGSLQDNAEKDNPLFYDIPKSDFGRASREFNSAAEPDDGSYLIVKNSAPPPVSLGQNKNNRDLYSSYWSRNSIEYPWGPDSEESNGGMPGVDISAGSDDMLGASNDSNRERIAHRWQLWTREYDENYRRYGDGNVGGIFTIGAWIKREKEDEEFIILSKTNLSELGNTSNFYSKYQFQCGISGASNRPFFTFWTDNKSGQYTLETSGKRTSSGDNKFQPGAFIYTSTKEVPVGEWTHISFVYDYDAGERVYDSETGEFINIDRDLEARVKIYVNGEEHGYSYSDAILNVDRTTSTSSSLSKPDDGIAHISINSPYLCIGGVAGTRSIYFGEESEPLSGPARVDPNNPPHGKATGKMADFRIYSTALTLEKIKNITNGYQPVEEDYLQAWWFKNENDLSDFGSSNNPLLDWDNRTSWNSDGPFKTKVYKNTPIDPCKWADYLHEFTKNSLAERHPSVTYNPAIQRCADLIFNIVTKALAGDGGKHYLTHVNVYDRNGVIPDQINSDDPLDYYMAFHPNKNISEEYLRRSFLSRHRYLKVGVNAYSHLGLFYKPYVISEKFRDYSSYADGYADYTIESTFDISPLLTDPREYDPEHDYQFKQYGARVIGDPYIYTRKNFRIIDFNSQPLHLGSSVEFNPDPTCDNALHITQTEINPGWPYYKEGDEITYEIKIQYVDPQSFNISNIISLPNETKIDPYSNSYLELSNDIPEEVDHAIDLKDIVYDDIRLSIDKQITIIDDSYNLFDGNICLNANDLKDGITVKYSSIVTAEEALDEKIINIVYVDYINDKCKEYYTPSPYTRVVNKNIIDIKPPGYLFVDYRQINPLDIDYNDINNLKVYKYLGNV